MSLIAPAIGIDFGTSNSKMAWYNPKTNQAESIRNAEGEEQTPSVVYFGESETLVGSPAEAMLEYEQERERIIISVKRELATTPMIALPDRSVKPVEVVAEILRKLKRDAEEQHFLQQITRAVITCPASFGPLDWDKIREAAQLAGFVEVEMLEEPVAAAIAYTQMGLKVGKYVLVYDLGGGTFDLAVLARDDDGLFHPALEPQGIKRCGGDDFDEALYNYCDAMAREKLGRAISLTGKRDLHFLSECRQRKENLSSTERRLFKSLLEPGAVLFQHEIDRVTFENLISPTVEKTVRKTVALLEQASAEGYGVDTVVLVGGSTRVPLAQRLLNESLPLKAIPWQHRDVAVAFGAAYQAYSLWRPENQYRKAVALAWTNKKLDQIKVAQLTTLANDLGLDAQQVTDLERAIMGGAKEAIFAHQRALEQYHLAVEAAWAERRLDEAKVEQLRAFANKLGLNKDQAADIEREVMGEIKEVLFARQMAIEQYRKAVEAAWVDKKLDKTKLEELVRLVSRLSLHERLVADIERSVMGETIEEIFVRQVALEQYRKAVGEAWIDRKLNETKIEQLNALANKLDLSQGQVAAIERTIMGEVKDAVFAHQRALEQYRKAVEEAWADKKLNRQKIAQLYALAAGLNLSDNQVDTIEREVMGGIKEVAFTHQMAPEQYREAVIAAWVSKKLEKQKIERLTALAKALGLSKEQVAQIERGVMGDAKETVFENQNREQYLKAVQSAWSDNKLDQAKLDHLTALAKELELSKEEAAQIEREVMDDTKEVIFARWVAFEQYHARQVVLGQYRKAVEEKWKDKKLDVTKITWLTVLAKELKLSYEEAAQIEREVMGQVKEVLSTPPIVSKPEPVKPPPIPLKTRLLQVLQTFQPLNGFYISSNIPHRKLANARDICNVPQSEEILGLIDCTVFGSAKDCVLFGTESIYYHNTASSGKIPYPELPSFPIRKSEKYAITAGNRKRISIAGSNISPEKLCDMLNSIKRVL